RGGRSLNAANRAQRRGWHLNEAAMPYDYYKPKLAEEPTNIALNEAFGRAAATRAELPRPYLGASGIGDECLRRIQYDWWCKPELPARTREIFDRGHYFEERARRLLVATGFKFAPPQALAFSAVGGAFPAHPHRLTL